MCRAVNVETPKKYKVNLFVSICINCYQTIFMKEYPDLICFLRNYDYIPFNCIYCSS